MKELYRTAEVAQRYGVTSQTIINYCNNGKIPQKDFIIVQGRCGKTYRFYSSVFNRLRKRDRESIIADAVKEKNRTAKRKLLNMVK